MRDPKRIEKALAVLRRIWTAYPDLRLGQIIEGAITPRADHCIFNIEDEEMVQGLEAYEKRLE